MLTPQAAIAQGEGGVGLNPTQTREFVRQYNLSAGTVNAVASRLRLPAGSSRTTILNALGRELAKASELRTQLTQAEAVIRELRDETVREPGLALLRDAQAAFARGDIDQARTKLVELQGIRWGESEQGTSAWLDATLMVSRASVLRGRSDEGKAALGSARASARASAVLVDWRLGLEDADIDIRQAWRTADVALLDSAIAQILNDVQLLAPRTTHPVQWARTQIVLADARLALGGWQNSVVPIDQAVAGYVDALPLIDAVDPTLAARSRFHLCSARTQVGRAYRQIESLLQALDECGIAAGMYAALSDRAGQVRASGQSSSIYWAMYKISHDEGDLAAARSSANDNIRNIRGVLGDADLANAYNNAGGISLQYYEDLNVFTELDVAERHFREAIRLLNRDDDPIFWANIKTNLGSALGMRARRSQDVDTYLEAFECLQEALLAMPRERQPDEWVDIERRLLFVKWELEARGIQPPQIRRNAF